MCWKKNAKQHSNVFSNASRVSNYEMSSSHTRGPPLNHASQQLAQDVSAALLLFPRVRVQRNSRAKKGLVFREIVAGTQKRMREIRPRREMTRAINLDKTRDDTANERARGNSWGIARRGGNENGGPWPRVIFILPRAYIYSSNCAAMFFLFSLEREWMPIVRALVWPVTV